MITHIFINFVSARSIFAACATNFFGNFYDVSFFYCSMNVFFSCAVCSVALFTVRAAVKHNENFRLKINFIIKKMCRRMVVGVRVAFACDDLWQSTCNFVVFFPLASELFRVSYCRHVARWLLLLLTIMRWTNWAQRETWISRFPLSGLKFQYAKRQNDFCSWSRFHRLVENIISWFKKREKYWPQKEKKN